MQIRLTDINDASLTISWDKEPDALSYTIFFANKNTPKMKYKELATIKENHFTLPYATHIPYYFKIRTNLEGGSRISDVFQTPVHKVLNEQLEKLNRGLIAVKTSEGVFLSWRLMLDEVDGYTKTGMSGCSFAVIKNGWEIAEVTDSTNYLDKEGTGTDRYKVMALYTDGHKETVFCPEVSAFPDDKPYVEIPLQIPPSGVTPAGEPYSYSANDMSIGDIDGDGEYEFFVKWDPSNSHDVSIKGYTGNCYIDCYRLNGTLLWRLDMGVNIRAGAHYTQFMVYDFNGDGMAEMALKTAPGTKMTIFHADGTIEKEFFVTMPKEDLEKGFSHSDDYRLSADGYSRHITEVFCNWLDHEMVKNKVWPQTLEECFGIPKKYSYPLSKKDAEELADYFIDVYAPSRSKKNDLRHFEGFIVDGPEYLTMFSGKGEELQTISFKYGRQDDGLMWGDYAMPRIEPANRVDRFLSGVAYLDGERPYLIVARGYYTRTTIVAYQFFENKFEEYFSIDSGHILMDNPFHANPHITEGTDPVYGKLAGQGNHSLSAADVDFDGCMEIIYGAAVIDHDGSLLYSSFDYLPDKKTYIKLGHGDAMHVADIDPDKPGLEIFNVFEAGKWGPYGYALRDAMTGKVLFGEYSEEDLGRCMIGDINPNVRGLQMWVYQVQDVNGDVLPDPLLGTNQNIHWAADLSTQVLDGVDLFGHHTGIINDNTHGIMLNPKGVAMNNGTKGNPCLVADLFGDWREELLVRTVDNNAIRIYTNTDLTSHKLFTLMHDTQYRCGIAWQNNCYNQPCYTKFYLASDMDWEYVLPQLAGHSDAKKPN